jgi:tol-pal system protein YbgF
LHLPGGEGLQSRNGDILIKEKRVKKGIGRYGLSLLILPLLGCAPMGAVTSLTGAAISGTIYVKNQKEERTFVASLAEVREAVRLALQRMAFTVKQEEAREGEHYILAAASEDYELDVIITSITPKATKVTVRADTIFERDKATGLEVLNQTSARLIPPPSPLPMTASTGANGGKTIPLRVAEVPPSLVPGHGVGSSPLPILPPPPQAAVRRELPVAPPGAKGEPSPPQILVKVEPTVPPIGKPGSSPSGAPTDPYTLYESAVNDYIQGHFPEAINKLRLYLSSRPSSGDASKARYWLGESLFSQQQYSQALTEFQGILREYPNSPEIPRALFRAAETYRRLGRSAEADALLKTLIRFHPKSREANLARDLMTKR